ncbi:MAG TPA: hypothetical protein VF207_02330, partial [Chthoniobacterales bacterium]
MVPALWDIRKQESIRGSVKSLGRKWFQLLNTHRKRKRAQDGAIHELAVGQIQIAGLPIIDHVFACALPTDQTRFEVSGSIQARRIVQGSGASSQITGNYLE